jgi:Ni/Co efflux regulator RcnB
MPNAVRTDRRTVDVSRWNRNFDAPHRYRARSYDAPRGYYYQRYSYGQRLPRIYYARNFWLMDFVMFGLFSPPEGYIWVRYGPDALLIDEETGEIVQVQYNVFYT